jgi:hypothetical protein
MTRSEKIAQHIAARIMANTQKRFSALHADALQEFQTMSTPTSSTLNGDGKGQTRPVIGREIPDNPASLAAEAPARLTPAPSSDSINSGMTVTTTQAEIGSPVAKQTSHKALEGSFAGQDFRAPNKGAGVTDQFKNQSGPREQMPGQKNSKYSSEDKGAGFQSTAPGLDSDAGV